MPLHQSVQNVLLVGVRLKHSPAPASAEPPLALRGLIAALEPEHQACNARAIEFGHRYRSAFWALYLLSALAVLFAILPEALGWIDERNPMHSWAPLWGCAELTVIAGVALLFFWGHKRDWQGQWLAARTQAELIGYLPLAAALLDPIDGEMDFGSQWFAALAGSGETAVEVNTIEALCRRHSALAQQSLAGAWRDAANWQAWIQALVAGQQHYHERVVLRHHALQHRVHRINTLLFALTGFGTAAHLFWHASWLMLVATVFPALGAALHGALAQSEAYRLEMNSRRLAGELKALGAAIARVDCNEPAAAEPALKELGRAALDLILAEHHDWHQLVMPHSLPLG